jgi:hypothetical protein
VTAENMLQWPMPHCAAQGLPRTVQSGCTHGGLVPQYHVQLGIVGGCEQYWFGRGQLPDIMITELVMHCKLQTWRDVSAASRLSWVETTGKQSSDRSLTHPATSAIWRHQNSHMLSSAICAVASGIQSPKWRVLMACWSTSQIQRHAAGHSRWCMRSAQFICINSPANPRTENIYIRCPATTVL